VSTAPTPHHIGAREITELLAWCRRLSAAGLDADPAERAAYLTAKTDLLTRITDPGAARRDGADPEEQR
jgi:hypothetical protein